MKGWWSKSSCPPSKVCLPWVWEGGTWDVPGILAGYPGPLGVFKKSAQKKFVRIFRSLIVNLKVPVPFPATRLINVKKLRSDDPCGHGAQGSSHGCYEKVRT